MSKLTKTQEIKLMIIENFIEYYTTNDDERDAMKMEAHTYVEEDHVDEIAQSGMGTLPTERKKVIERASHYLSGCDSDEELVDMIMAIAKHSDDADMIDQVDDVIVWEKVEWEYTCSDFLDEIGYYEGFENDK